MTDDFALTSPFRKIPKLDGYYWLLLIAATIFGETGGDMLSMGLNLGYLAATAIFLALFAVALFFQVRSPGDQPAYYWAVIIATSTTGTTIADAMTRTFELGYAQGSALLLGVLALVFAAWKFSGSRLTETGRLPKSAEVLYWVGILVASTLGTAFGDYIADESGLGFAGSSALLAVLLTLVAGLQRFAPNQKEIFYWAAIVIVHPLGATAGDFLTKDQAEGGLGLGTFVASAGLGLLFVIVYALVHRRRGAQSVARN